MDVAELVHYDPKARRIRNRLADALDARGIAWDLDDLSERAYALAFAGRDLLATRSVCLRARAGLPCDITAGCCCDIPF